MEGHRKLIFCGSVFIVCCVLLWVGKLPPVNFESIVWAVLLAFSGGNVGEHWSRRVADSRYKREYDG